MGRGKAWGGWLAVVMAASDGTSNHNLAALFIGLWALAMAVLQALAAAGRLPRLNFWPFVRSQNKVLRWGAAALAAALAVACLTLFAVGSG